MLDTLFARETLAPTSKKLGRGRKRQQARPYFFFALSLGYVRKSPHLSWMISTLHKPHHLSNECCEIGTMSRRDLLETFAKADASLSGSHPDLLLHARLSQRRHQFIRLHPPLPAHLQPICRDQGIGLQEIRKRKPVSDTLCGYRGEISISIDVVCDCFEKHD